MQISFWSNCERSGVTCNLAATGVMLSHIYPCRIVLIEDHVSSKNLGKVLMGTGYEKRMNRREIPGVAEKMTGFSGEKKNDFYIRETGNKRIEIIEDSLYYIMHNPVAVQKIEDFDMYIRLSRAASEAEKNGELLFIDAHSGFGLNSKIVLDSSDMIVVNLKQDADIIENFLKNYSAIIYKCVFILESYKNVPWLNKREIALKYGLNEKKMSVIPYNSDFEMAALGGNVAEFIRENYKCRQQTKNYNFIRELKFTANMIMHNILVAQRCRGGMTNYI